MKVVGKYSKKPYKCRECGSEKEIGTNHWGACYPFCTVCKMQTPWDCLEPIPDGYKKPEEWKWVKLGNIAKITKGGC